MGEESIDVFATKTLDDRAESIAKEVVGCYINFCSNGLSGPLTIAYLLSDQAGPTRAAYTAATITASSSTDGSIPSS